MAESTSHVRFAATRGSITRRLFRDQPPRLEPDGAPRPRAAEFFAGIGLVRLAIEKAGFDVVFANDIDPMKHKIYADNFSVGDFVLGDIHQIAADSIPNCELFTASFPCNDLSVAGAQSGLDGAQSSAFWGLIRILRELGERRPAVVMLENVPGFLASQGGRDFARALTALNELGYLVDAVMIDAARFVPQSRQRLFVVASGPHLRVLGHEAAQELAAASAPKQLEQLEQLGQLQPSVWRPRALTDFITKHPELAWRLADLPALPTGRPRLRDVIEKLPDDDPAWWVEKRVEYFMSQLSPRHAAEAALMIAGHRVSYGTAFRRVRHGKSMAELRTDGIAGCLRTPRGGSGRQILFKAGQGRRQVRLLTARECARLQGVPDSYEIKVPLNQALFGFGDAVCVPAVEWLARHYLLPVARAALAPLDRESPTR
jgi:DNA (cytosine-5)-methyltransferase 1